MGNHCRPDRSQFGIFGLILLTSMFTFLAVLSTATALGIHASLTGSIPKGIYIYKSHSVNKYDLVVVKQPKTPYMEKNAWRFSSFFIKTIYAINGDYITISDIGVIINGKLTKNSAPIKFKNGNVSAVELTDYELQENEYFLLSNFVPNSYDGRYFGITHKCEILYAVKPLLLF